MTTAEAITTILDKLTRLEWILGHVERVGEDRVEIGPIPWTPKGVAKATFLKALSAPINTIPAMKQKASEILAELGPLNEQESRVLELIIFNVPPPRTLADLSKHLDLI